VQEKIFMKYRIDSKVFELVPRFCRGVIVARSLDNTTVDDPALYQLLREQVGLAETDVEADLDHPRIKAWMEVYKTFPTAKDKGRVEPSVAALVRRIKGGTGDTIPFISPLVCISNLASIKHLVPSGLIDADKIQGDLVLGVARGTERYEPIGREGTAPIEPGEIVYYDSGTGAVLCRAWNSRGGKAGLIQFNTRNAVIDIDGLLTVITRDQIGAAANEVAELLTRHCGARTSVHFLSRSNPELLF
jgi:DNA/RNA-binding domain of Phe-tRNA-synthetase-like protein